MTIPQQTRRASYDETNRRLALATREIFNEILMRGPCGAWEIAAATDRMVYTVRPRLTELQKAGRIKAVGTRWHAPTERREAVWDVVDRQVQLSL